VGYFCRLIPLLKPFRKKAALHKWADLIEKHATRLDALDALEMGKPVSVRAFDAASAAARVRFNAEAVDKCFGDVLTRDASSTLIQKKMPGSTRRPNR
jgi:acyl-CoA reductase-like NAD-dependent aldehyde dehydrogenase